MSTWQIVEAHQTHITPIAEYMRDMDRLEVWATSRKEPAEALAESLDNSTLAWTCLVEEQPAFMWGVGRSGCLLTNTGGPWLLATPALRKVQWSFSRLCRNYVEQMHSHYSVLANRVHADNKTALRWLEWCGFTIDREHALRLRGELFYPFRSERPCVH